MGSSGEFTPHWTMSENPAPNGNTRGARKGRSNHSIDKMSINSGLSSNDGSQVSFDRSAKLNAILVIGFSKLSIFIFHTLFYLLHSQAETLVKMEEVC